MPQIGPAEILVILLVGLLVFGPNRLPEIGRQVGRGMRELKKFQDTVKGELDDVLHLNEHEEVATVEPPRFDTPPIDVPGETSLPPSHRPEALNGNGSGTPTPPPTPPARAPSRFRPPGPPSST